MVAIAGAPTSAAVVAAIVSTRGRAVAGFAERCLAVRGVLGLEAGCARSPAAVFTLRLRGAEAGSAEAAATTVSGETRASFLLLEGVPGDDFPVCMASILAKLRNNSSKKCFIQAISVWQLVTHVVVEYGAVKILEQ